MQKRNIVYIAVIHLARHLQTLIPMSDALTQAHASGRSTQRMPHL